jgi:hypothetical protein
MAEFKRALVPGARFMVEFEPTRIVGNVSTTEIPRAIKARKVIRTTGHMVYFENEKGAKTSLSFPPASEFSSPAPGEFVWTANGKKVLTYRQVVGVPVSVGEPHLAV